MFVLTRFYSIVIVPLTNNKKEQCVGEVRHFAKEILKYQKRDKTSRSDIYGDEMTSFVYTELFLVFGKRQIHYSSKIHTSCWMNVITKIIFEISAILQLPKLNIKK